jgi:hypothetical protein
MGTLADCMRELKRFEDLTLHHPLVHEGYMIPKDHRELMRNPNLIITHVDASHLG